MSNVFQDHDKRLRGMTEQMVRTGWLDEQDAAGLNQIERQDVEQLFKQQKHRPLIVGFFGGTGVGKSSLLNRLAGNGIARVGVERPTSHEVTLYLHKDFELAELPPELPVETTRISYHQQEQRRLVAWLDMPDIDSTAQENRAIVESWLPYLDWVIYVVSPDRYFDDVGWRFLQSRGQRHAWLFVMNHWDEGREEQLEDFRHRLQDEGFDSPTILTTSCKEGAGQDEFDKLEQTISAAIDQYGIKVLQQLGVQARINDLKKNIDGFLSRLGSDKTWTQSASQWNQLIDQRLDKLASTLYDSAGIITQHLPDKSDSRVRLHLPFLGRSEEVQDKPLIQAPKVDALVNSLWNERSHGRLSDLNTGLLNSLQTAGLSIAPFKQAMDSLESDMDGRAERILDEELTAVLANPGTRWQRFIYRAMDKLTLLLPLAAAIWAIYHVVGTYYAGTQGEAEFLGLNFAIHSGLLMGLAWLLPWLLKQKVKPSVAASSKRGLENGVNVTLAAIRADYSALWAAMKQQRSDFVTELANEKIKLDGLSANPSTDLSVFVNQR